MVISEIIPSDEEVLNSYEFDKASLEIKDAPKSFGEVVSENKNQRMNRSTEE